MTNICSARSVTDYEGNQKHWPNASTQDNTIYELGTQLTAGDKAAEAPPTQYASSPLFYRVPLGVELKESMTTSQAPAQCVLRGQGGRYTSLHRRSFLRTSTLLNGNFW